MQAYQVTTPTGIEDIRKVELATPTPGAGELLVRMKACSLNYRDILVANGGYPRNDVRPVIPVSDGAGEVVSVGEGVSRFAVGDRVVGNFLQGWLSGKVDEPALLTALGGAIDGVLAEYFLLKEDGALPVPASLSYEQVATLPCAALTAWHALVPRGHLQPGMTVLAQGTGGVSVFALQLAKALGAEVIITSSSDDKLERAKALGADHVINYRSHENWGAVARELTGGRGVDHVIEVGGEKTFSQSIECCALNGTISVIGILSGFDIPFSLLAALNNLTVNGIYVGSVEMFRDMLAVVEQHKIEPVIHEVVPFDDALDGYRLLASQQHMGKVVIQGH